MLSCPVLIASKLIPAGTRLADAVLRRAATVELDWDTRQRSRFDAIDSSGREIAVFLPRGRAVRGGDVLVTEDGSLVLVRAKAQPVLVVRGAAQAPAHDLARAAYHLGNRHVPLEVRADRLQLEPDHVLADMLQGMGFAVEPAVAAFEPEGGAYQTAHHGNGSRPGSPHVHHHASGHEDPSGERHAHGHEHESAHPPGHVHR